VREGLSVRKNNTSGIYKFVRKQRTGYIVKNDEGVGYQSDYTFSIQDISVPAWLAKLLKFGGDGVAKYLELNCSSKPDWNKLVSLSWRVVKSRSAASLVPDKKFVLFVENEVMRKLRFGRFVEVVASSRAGKSAGMVRGIVRWVIENDLMNYVVLYVVPFRVQAITAYRYVIGALISLFKELRRSGVKISRGEFFSRVRIRLYLGGEQSCLMNRKKHFIEYCIKSCSLFKRYEKKWRKLPPAPILDPWMLRLSGYCPFVAVFSKSFWYKSIVVLTYHSLPLALSNVIRHNIRNVIIVFDEYIKLLKDMRGVLMKLDIEKIKNVFGDVFDAVFEVCVDDSVLNVSLKKAIEAWNSVVDEIDEIMYNVYNDLVSDVVFKYGGVLLAYYLLDVFARKHINLYDVVRDKLRDLYDIARVVLEISKKVKDVEKRAKIKRLGSWMLRNALSTVHADNKSRSAILHWKGSRQEYIIAYNGSCIRGVIAYLSSKKRNVAVLSTGVVDCDVYTYSIVPHERLEHVRIRVDKIFKSVRSSKLQWSAKMFYKRNECLSNYDRYIIMKSMNELYSVLNAVVNNRGNHVIVANKSIIQYIARILKNEFKLKIEVYGDLERGVIDYIIVNKNNGKILLVSPHSRVAMGVDPPIENPKMLIILFGLRRPAVEYIKLDSIVYDKLYYVDSELGLMDLRVYSENNLYYVARADTKHTYLYIYDVFDVKYDLHMLLQIIGRWYMHDVELMVYNAKYNIHSIEYYIFDAEVLYNLPKSKYYVQVSTKHGENITWRIVKPVSSFGDAVNEIIKYEKHDSAIKIMKRDYYSLKNVYNSLRYIRKQLKYRRIDKDEEWWIAKKIAKMISGFEYAHKNNLEVPSGIKTFYQIYISEGAGELIEYIRKYLNVDRKTWRRIVMKLVYAYSIKSMYLMYSYRLVKIPRDVVIEGINDANVDSIDKYVKFR